MRRMISEKAQKYIKDLATNHPDPSAEWGGSGTEYTAGDNITIEDGVISATDTTYTAGPGIDINTASNNSVRTKISIVGGLNYDNNGNMIVDNNVVAFKSDLATVATSGNYTDLTNKPDLSVYERKDFLLELTGTSGTLTSTQRDLINASDGIGCKIKVTPYTGYELFFVIALAQKEDDHYMFLIAPNAQYTTALGKQGTDFSIGSSEALRIDYDYGNYTYTWGLANIDAGIKFSSDFTATWDSNNILTVGLVNSIPTTAISTSTSSVTPSTVQLTFTYSDNTTETITLMTGASVSTTTTTTLS